MSLVSSTSSASAKLGYEARSTTTQSHAGNHKRPALQAILRCERLQRLLPGGGGAAITGGPQSAAGDS